MQEEWRQITAINGVEVSSLGRIRSWVPPGSSTQRRASPIILRLALGGSGYPTLVRRIGNFKVHHLVLAAFVGPRPSPQHQARHLNGCRTDNRVENLAWGTCRENYADKVAHKTEPSGARNGSAKLTWDDARKIRTSNESPRTLAGRYGISTIAVWRIRSGRSWREDRA